LSIPEKASSIKRPERRSAPHREVTLGVLQRWQHIERDPTLELEAKARALIFAADAQEIRSLIRMPAGDRAGCGRNCVRHHFGLRNWVQ
jgi:hypothetical protein